MGCWKSRKVTCVMSGRRCYPQRLICRSCKSSFGHFAAAGGRWFGVLAHNRVALTDELQDCTHGFFVQITITGATPAHAVDVCESGQLMHLDYHPIARHLAGAIVILGSHRYLALCGPINDLDACYDPARTYMVAAPGGPSRISAEAVTVLYVRVRVDGF